MSSHEGRGGASGDRQASEGDGRTRRSVLGSLATVGVAGTGLSRTTDRAAASSHRTTEDGEDLDDWRVFEDGFGPTTAYAYEGERSLGIRAEGIDRRIAAYEPDVLAGGRRIDSFVGNWLELSGSYGGGLRLLDADGNVVCGFATDNPEWYVEHTAPETLDRVGLTEAGYETWVGTTVDFDWDAGTFTIEFDESGAPDNRVTRTFELVNATSVAAVEVQNFANTVGEKSGWTGADSSDYDDFSVEMFFDSLTVVDGEGDAAETTETDDEEDDARTIVRVNDAGETFQRGRLTDPPESLTPGSEIGIEIQVTALTDGAQSNVVFAAIGNSNGEVYGLNEMQNTGTGAVTVTAEIPEDAPERVYWTWVPASSARGALEKAERSLLNRVDVGLPESDSFSNDGRLALPLGPVTEAEQADDAGNDQTIVRVNDAGEAFQRGRLTSAPESVTAGSEAGVEIQVTALTDDAQANIVFAAIGGGDGTVYGLAEMDEAGSGTVTVTAEIPETATGDVYWTWVPAVSRESAREKAERSLANQTGDTLPPSDSFSNDGRIAYPIGAVGDGEETEETDDGDGPRLCVESVSVGVDAETTAAVRLTGFDPGFSGADLRLRFPSTVTPTAATAAESFGTATAETDGQVARLKVADLSDRLGPDDDEIRLGTVQLTGAAAGSGRVEIADQTVDTDAGESVTVRLAADCGRVAATERSCPTVDGTATTDPDDDGDCEDLNGNGRADFDDVTEFFENVGSDDVEGADAFDFNDNGRIDFDDVRALFEEVS